MASKKLRIDLNRASIFQVGRVFLKAGKNILDFEQAQKFLRHKLVKAAVEEGLLTVKETEGEQDENQSEKKAENNVTIKVKKSKKANKKKASRPKKIEITEEIHHEEIKEDLEELQE